MVTGRWGSWEELLLGGAVLRHGTRDWDAVAVELQTRTVCPFTFTAQVCKAKYEDLQKRFSGCIALFDELRKQRMAELKKALEVSEDSIGSLESKLEILKADVGHESSQNELHLPYHKFDGIDSYSKEISKDGLSAGSFTQEKKPNLSHECQNPVSAGTIEAKQECSVSPEQEKVSIMEKLANFMSIGQGLCIKRRRGKRKRKDCSKDVKEGSVGESEYWGSADVLSATRKDNSTSSSGQIAGCSGADDQCRGSSKDTNANLMEIFDSIAENKCATVFRRRLDSQKRGRYKRMILRHMDFDTIRSRIANCSITSAKEVFRDLLLLANNAMVFYSKTTREYKSALLLRDIVTKHLRQHLKNYISRATIALLSSTPLLNPPPVKPRTALPCNRNWGKAAARNGKVAVKTTTPDVVQKTGSACSPTSTESVVVRKRGSGRPRKAGRGGSTAQRPEKPTRGRKRSLAK